MYPILYIIYILIHLRVVKNVSDEEKLNSQFSSCIICVYTFYFFVSYIEIILKKIFGDV